MKKADKYDVSGFIEAQFEPGSRGKVLKNMKGIKTKSEMDELEALALKQTEEYMIMKFGKNHRFTSDDLCLIHKVWLGNIYEWAGKYRKVNISKVDFQFAAAEQIPSLMFNFNKELLSRFTPCNFDSLADIIKAIAITHVEFLLIHPFREGNGRLARLISNHMAAQAGYPYLNYSKLNNELREEYFSAVRAGIDRNYVPMEEIFKKVFQITLKATDAK
jgi:cell filamentation protein